MAEPRVLEGNGLPHAHIVYSEIISVTSVMRKNSRWATNFGINHRRDMHLAASMGLRRGATDDSSGSPGPRREVDLMGGFEYLKRKIRDVQDVHEVPIIEILEPFVAVISSPTSTGPITSAALTSLSTFFITGVIVSDNSTIACLSELSGALSRCVFEPSDSGRDEAVLLKIIGVIKDCICSPYGALLSDVEACEMLEKVLTICCQMRASEVLRRTAESNMQTITREVFGRLRGLDPVVEEQRMRQEEEEANAELKLVLSPTKVTNPLPGNDNPNSESGQAPGMRGPESEPRPYGLPTVAEVLRVLINLLDPNDQQHTDTIRLTALGVLTAALSSCFPTPAPASTTNQSSSTHSLTQFPSLLSLLADRACRHLFLLARTEAPALRLAALKAIAVLFEVGRGSLKLQRELFLSFLVARLEPIGPVNDGKQGVGGKQGPGIDTPNSIARPGTPSLATPRTPALGTPKTGAVAGGVDPALRELMLETLVLLSREPSFMVDLWANYDCDVNCEDIFERLIGFLTKSTYPLLGGVGGQQQYASRLICLDLLLAYVDRMHARVENPAAVQNWYSTTVSPESLLFTKSRKLLVLTAAQKFNEKPKKGVQFMLDNGLVDYQAEETLDPAAEPEKSEEPGHADKKEKPRKADPKSLALFLKNCPKLDKKGLGEYISHLDNPELLKEFIGLFDFREKPIAEGLRELLESFRLPGEAQPIARITETFAKSFFAAGPPGIKSEDAVFVLSYSVILLNTDLHNPQNRKRMTIMDYKKNLKGVNDGTDFDPDYLQAIYDGLRKREIIMPEEHTGQLGFDYAWKELLLRSKTAGEYIVCNTSAFDKQMFELTWRPVIQAIAFAFTNINDDYVIERAVAGFRQCATLAGYFGLPEVFDFVVGQLSQATGLIAPVLTRSAVYPIVQVEGQDITVSPLSVRFGTNLRGQLAAVVLFNIANGNGNAIREGWAEIFEMFESLFFHSLLPTRMLQMEDFLGGVSMIPLQGGPVVTPIQQRSDTGLLSALSSYLLTPYGASVENVMSQPTEEDIENTLSAIDCVTSCKLDELYGQITSLELDALVAAMKALQVLADRRASLQVDPPSRDEMQTGPTTPVSPLPSDSQHPYDPTSVFLLEMMVSIAVQTSEHIDETWPIVFEHLSMILSSSMRYSVLLVERAVVGLLRLCRVASSKPGLRDQIYISLDILGGLPPAVFNTTTEQIVAGLALLVQEQPTVISSQTEWALVFGLLRGSIVNPEAARTSFDLLIQMASTPERISSDNISGLITSIEEFATAAGNGVGGKRPRQGRVPPPLIPDASVERGVKAVGVLADLKKVIPNLGLSPDAYWHVWINLLAVFGRQSTNPSRDVRHAALAHLQRILLGLQTPESRSVEIFDRVVLPMSEELLKPQVAQRDPDGIIETRLRASALLCRSFLYLQAQPDTLSPETRALWLRIIDVLQACMHSGGRDQLAEAIPESLKNVVLVMNASGLLVPPETPDTRSELQQELWQDTVDKIERFLPGFIEELFPPPPPQPEPAPPAPESAPQEAQATEPPA